MIVLLTIRIEDIDKAKQEFEKVLELVPDNPDSMKILGSLYIKSGNHEKAIELLKRSNQRKTADLETIIELAQLLETAELSVYIYSPQLHSSPTTFQ